MRGSNICSLLIAISVCVSAGCSPRVADSSAPEKASAIDELHADGENGTWLNYKRGEGDIIWHEASNLGGWVNWGIEIPAAWEVVSLEHKEKALNLNTLKHGKFRLPREKLMKFISITYEGEGYEINSLWEAYKVSETEILPLQSSIKK